MTGSTTAPASRSQYAGTLKNTICQFCKKELNNLNREQQDAHAESHKGQKTL